MSAVPTRVLLATNNDYKFSELERLFAPHGIVLEHLRSDFSELQTPDYEAIAIDKAAQAYRTWGVPVMIEVCGIGVRTLGDFPSGLNRRFWAILGSRISEITNVLGNAADASVALSICDGKRIHTVFESTAGTIATAPSKNGTFHLDQVFIPDGATTTLADMTPAGRDLVSYRGKVVPRMADLLKSTNLAGVLA